MSEQVLFVDDEENILNSVERIFAGHDFPILRAGSAREALEIMAREEIAVVVSDNMMPGMRGIEMLAQAKDISPDTVKILMTAYADLPTALSAINQGEVFRFLVKPWENSELVATVAQGLARYRTLKLMRREDEAVLNSLAQAIELKDSYTRGHCDRVARYALMIAEAIGLPEDTRKEIRFGSWLHDCGKIGVPETILNYSGPINVMEFETIKNHPKWGAEVARQAFLSESVINIILYHHERFDGAGYPEGLAGAAIPLEARIVSIADVYDALTTDRPYRRGFHWAKAIKIITALGGNSLDPELVTVFLDSIRKMRCFTEDNLAKGENHE